MPLLSLEQPFALAPIFKERPWGGQRLARVLDKPIPSDRLIGESWELSDHPHGHSTVARTGEPLAALFAREPEALLGAPLPPGGYPLLIKFLDAMGDLSVQDHPDDTWNRAHGIADRGKSECWYVMDCPMGAEVIAGVRPGVTLGQVREALQANDPLPLLRRVPIRPGSFLAIPPGTIHALCAGALVCEIQQASDTTFRLWDWDRKPARELHVEEGLAVARLESCPIEHHLPPVNAAPTVVTRGLANTEHFRVWSVDVPPGRRIPVALRSTRPLGTAMCVVEGTGSWAGRAEGTLSRGAVWFLPANGRGPWELQAGERGLRVLLTEPVHA